MTDIQFYVLTSVYVTVALSIGVFRLVEIKKLK
jgi:hypothetical protein